MGTGVGEIALADAAILGGEYAGGLGLTGALTGGVADAALLGGEFAGGLGALGATGALAGGLGNAALLGGEYAGGLGSLSPAFQSAVGQTASVMPEVAAQTVEAANAGVVPSAGTPLGTGQMGDPSLLQNVNATMDLDIRPDQIVDSAEPITRMAGNADKAALLSEAGFGPLASPAELGTAAKSPFFNPLTSIYNTWKDQDPLTKGVTGGIGALQVAKYLNKPQGVAAPEKYNGPLSKFTYSPNTYTPYTYKPYAAGGPVEEMSRENAMGANTGYPQADIRQGAYATPWQTPVSRNVVAGADDANVDIMTGAERMAGGGIANLGGYSDGGRLLKGPGDGMSDNIPANISGKQPARLADGEFVVPADVVSGLGNGSTDAGAKQLYKMLDKVRAARTGTKKQGKQIKPEKYTPA